MEYNNLLKTDPEVYKYIQCEINRQQTCIELIASENFTSKAVMEAQGSELTNKYAEGYPAKRYYGGCHFVDEIENIARDRIKQIFGAEYANVQPHSGSQANMAVYNALLNPGDKVMGMDLSHGGHLTHGSPVNFSGKLYEFHSYGVDKDNGLINYEELREKAKNIRPKLIVAGASAYPRIINFKAIKEICDEVHAYMMVDMAHIAGLVAAGLHPNPVPFADFVTTTTHKTLRGPRGGAILCKEKYGKSIDKSIFPGIQGGPLMHIIAAKAVCFKEAMQHDFRVYQENVVLNAKTLADEFIKHNFKLVSSGTDNHLILVDLRNKDITGKDAEALLDSIGITVNKNTIPYDPLSPFITSGIRIGSPAVTTRGFGSRDMVEIVDIIDSVIKNREGELSSYRDRVQKLCDAHPLKPQK